MVRRASEPVYPKKACMVLFQYNYEVPSKRDISGGSLSSIICPGSPPGIGKCGGIPGKPGGGIIPSGVGKPGGGKGMFGCI